MSAWSATTTALACLSIARPNAAFSQRVSAAVRSATSCACAVGFAKGLAQGSVSLFEPGMLRVTKTTLPSSHITIFETQRLARPGEKQVPHRRQFLQRIAALEFLGLLAVRPFIVARRIDEGKFELLELEIDALVPARLRGGYRRQNAGTGAGLAAGMDVSDVKDEADIRIGIDRIDQQRRVIEQDLTVGPVAEYGDGLPVIASVVVVTVVGDRGMTCREYRGEQRGREQKPLHGVFPRKGYGMRKARGCRRKSHSQKM